MLVAVTLGLVGAVTVTDALIPYWSISQWTIPLINLPIQHFGMIVAAGVLIGAAVMRRYADRHGVDDDDLRKLIGWVVVTGFIGAHVFDVLAYNRAEMAKDPLLIIKLWKGISSFGGFLGGAAGYAFFVWWKRMTPGLIGDATIVGLLVAFSIGRIACTLVHDHIGRPTDFGMGFEYPVDALKSREVYDSIVAAGASPDATVIRAHNLGFYEMLVLIPINAIILGLAFQRRWRLPAGLLAVLTGLLYSPIRFFFEYLRLNAPDPRYAGLTFAQWASIAATIAAIVAGVHLLRKGKPAPLAAELGKRPGGRRATMALIEAEAKAAAEGKTKKKPSEDKKAEKAEKADEAEPAEHAEPAPDDKPAAAKPTAKKGGGGGKKSGKKR